MATLTRGLTITPTTIVTAATLHTLIESATLVGLLGSDIGGGGLLFVASTNATPNPSLSPFWYDPSEDDPIFRVWASQWNIWLAVGPDRFEIPMRNESGTLCMKGTLVVAGDTPYKFTIGSSPSINVIGFLQAETQAGAYGPVATMGIGWALYASSTSIAGGGVPANAFTVVARGCKPGTVAGFNMYPLVGSGPMFGQWLEGDRSGASGSMQAKRIHIWGPRLTVGF